MLAKTSHPSPSFFTITTLCLLICLASVTEVSAQKTPPLLKGGEFSALDPDQIKDLRNRAIAGNTDDAKLARNRLIAITVEQVDTAFNDYRKKSRKRTDTLQFLFDFLEIGASSAISIVGGLRSKTLVGEGLSLFQGSRSAFNKDFRFLERQILFDKMVANRSDKLAAIYDKLNQNTSQYPWEQARSELRDYFFAGTIDEALSSLSRDTGAQARTAETALTGAKRTAGIVGAPTKEEIAASIANFDLIVDISSVGIPAERALAAERMKAVASQDKAKIATLEKTTRDVLDDWRGLFDAIQANQKLNALLGQIPRVYSQGDPAERQNLEDQLRRVKENKNASLTDYDQLATKLSDLASQSATTDPSLSANLSMILSASKTLKKATP
jgi:hypothetical protein